MASIVVLVASVVRVIIQPILIGSAAIVLAVAREISPRWLTGVRSQILDVVLAALIFLLFVYVLLKIQTV